MSTYDRPEIEVTTDLPSLVLEAEDALLARGGIYRRQGLVEVDTESKNGSPLIEQIGRSRIRDLLAQAAKFKRWNAKSECWKSCLPPVYVGDTIVARRGARFPYLRGILESPSLRPDGSLIADPGYDVSTGLLYRPLIEFPEIPTSPNRQEAAEALEKLWEPFTDFPLGPVDRAVLLASILSIVAASAIQGPRPAIAFRAASPGTGKTLAAEIVAIIGSGHKPMTLPPPKSEQEAEKRILSLALGGAPVVLIDNIVGPFGSPPIASALTATEISGRILRKSEMARLPNVTSWLLTGNGFTLVDDLGRRVLVAELDAGVEFPELRDKFQHKALERYVRQHRAWLYSRALVVLVAFHAAGRPRLAGVPLGSYEDWDAWVRNALVWLGEADPVESQARLRDEMDDDRERIGDVYAAWHQFYGDTPKTLREAIYDIRCCAELGYAFEALTRDGVFNTRSLGSFFKGIQGRIVNGLQLKKAGSRQRAALWHVVAIQSSESRESGEST